MCRGKTIISKTILEVLDEDDDFQSYLALMEGVYAEQMAEEEEENLALEEEIQPLEEEWLTGATGLTPSHGDSYVTRIWLWTDFFSTPPFDFERVEYHERGESETESETPLSDSDSMPPLDPPLALESDTSDSEDL